MASSSGSPRARIDQFFPSRKRRPSSSKHEKAPERDLKSSNDAQSPSTKGSLAEYLVKSPEQPNLSSHPGLVPCSPSRGDQVRRNLALDVIPVSGGCTEVSTSSLGTDADRAAARTGSDEVQLDAGRPEIKKFANDFLSLYCSELQSAVDAPAEESSKGLKRNGSPSLLVANAKSCTKKHRVVDQDGVSAEVGETALEQGCFKDTEPRDMECSKVNAEATLGCDLKAGDITALRKCSSTGAGLKKVGCLTPCTSVRAFDTHQTPKSACRSSSFSPGEEFWNEAIHVADCLVGPHDNSSVHSSKMPASKNEKQPGIPCYPRSGGSSSKAGNDLLPSNMPSNGVVEQLETFGGDHVLEGSRSNSYLVEENDAENNSRPPTRASKSHSDESPLPVKHLDFLYEGHNHKETNEDGQVRESKVGADSGGSFFPKDGLQIHPSSYSSSHHKKNGVDTPSSGVPFKDKLQLSSWLPPEICAAYTKKGISKLYPWQVDCLHVEGVLEKKNLVYCASTSAGKSFVAEILMLRQVIFSGKMAILVLPYVSICAEKAEHLETILEPLRKHVRSFYGNEGGGSLPKNTSVAVCTIEKANVLVNRLLEEDRLSEVGIIVIDELHMVGDQHRGYLLELMLTKLRYASGDGSLEISNGESSGSSSSKNGLAHGLQVVGMSATMPNVNAVADWLQAAFYQTTFRPVPLEEYIKVGNNILDKKMNLVRSIPKNADHGGRDPDHVVELCREVIMEGHSVLIFCSSRKGCESTARHVSKFLGRYPSTNKNNDEEFTVASAIEALQRCPAGLDPILEETVPSGVAYHHAGLTVEEREIIETFYRRGLIRVLMATSTLAAGVNLPARRVIFRQPRIGRDFIDGTRYRQMAGRAGRTGIDAKGESILICKSDELKKISALLNDDCPPLESCLSDDKNGMTHAILEVVAGGIVQTANDIHRYVRCTLLNSTKPFEDVVKSAQDSLRWLCHNKFLEWNAETSLYCTTPLGRAAFGSSLSPEESLVVLEDLVRAREGFVLSSDLHLVYLVTPINVEIEPDWELYYGRFMELSALEQSVGNRVGVVEPFLMRMAHGAPMHISEKLHGKKKFHGKWPSRGVNPGSSSYDSQVLRVSKRFYVALMLSKLVQEVPILDVCDAYKVSRGMIQSLQENAGRFASMVSSFCERLSWQDLGDLIAKFQNRVSFGVRAEIVELTSIPFVKGSRARALYKAGLRTPLAIAESSILDIARALFESSSWTTQDSSGMRRMQIGVAKKIKNGARRIVLEKAEEARVAAFSAFQSLGVEVPQFSVALPVCKDEVSCKQDNVATSDSEVSMVHSKKEVKNDVDFSSGLVVRGWEDEDKKYKSSEVTELKLMNPTSGNEVTTLDLLPESSSLNTILLEKKDGDGNGTSSLPLELNKEEISKNYTSARRLGQDVEDSSNHGRVSAFVAGPICAGSLPGGIDYFMEQWEAVEEFYFDIHFSKRTANDSPMLFEIFGLAICWKESPVYYMNLSKDLISYGKSVRDSIPGGSASDISKYKVASQTDSWKRAGQRWSWIARIMGKCGVRKITWNLKTQIQVLRHCGVSIQRFGGIKNECDGFGEFRLVDDTYIFLPSLYLQDGFDVCLLTWVLWPDEESSCSNLDKVVKKRLSPEALATANLDGRWKNQMRKVAHNGCCRRAALTRALASGLWRLLLSENLLEVLNKIENPLVRVLADMEHWGIGVDMEGCLRARQILGKRIKELEMEAFKLAGVSFSLHSTADIANILFTRLKLPMPDGCNKGKQHPSTDKHSLDLLRGQHPIISVIKEHRTLSKLFSSTLGSICSRAKLCVKSQKHVIKGNWLQTSTATGRLSMEDPKSAGTSLSSQCPRFFIPTQDKWILLTADYSQIELRLMAHFSKDLSLCDIVSRPDGDVFVMLAARWTGKLECEINSQEREHMKRLIYGILYGMGATSLAEQLGCNLEEAMEKIQSFKTSFPGVSAWLQKAVDLCRERGYIETLMGRKRFLSKIKIGTSKEKAKAQRQAVNSICQGSAADIIKIAMINIYAVVSEETKVSEILCHNIGSEYDVLKGHCHLLLQVHDELVMEVDPPFINEAGLLLKRCMETAASLLVPLRVKLKVGRSWGSLEPFVPKS